MTTKKVEISEAEAIQRMAHVIWPLVYDWMITREQISYMLEMMYRPEKIVQEMEDGTQYHWVYSDSEKIGFFSCGPLSESGDFPLHKLYIHPEKQGQGGGKLAIQKVEQLALEQKANRISLRVNRTNQKAINFYLGIGFEIDCADCAEIGGGFVMDDYILTKVP